MSKSKRIAFCAMTAAIIAVVGWLPWVFLVPVLVVSICFDWKMSIFASAAFGFISLFYALIFPTSNVALLMTSPYTFWIPVFARLPIGVIAHFAYKGFNGLFKSKVGSVASVSIAAAFGTLTNTVLFVPLVVLCAPESMNGIVAAFIAEFPISAAIELGVALIVVPAVVYAVNKSRIRLSGKSGKETKNNAEKED